MGSKALVRLTYIEPKSITAFALTLGAVTLLFDVVVIVLVWAALGVLGIFSALGFGLAVGSLLTISLLVGLSHAAVTAVFVWLAATAFNLTADWRGGLVIELAQDEPAIVLPDTEFGGAPTPGVTSPSRLDHPVQHGGL